MTVMTRCVFMRLPASQPGDDKLGMNGWLAAAMVEGVLRPENLRSSVHGVMLRHAHAS